MDKKKGGKNNKKEKKLDIKINRDIQFKEDGQAYAKVVKVLGDCRIELDCYDGIKRIGHIRGAMRYRTWISVGDVVLIGYREFQDSKCDVILKYTNDELKKLINHSEIKGETNKETDNKENDEECGFTFEDI